MVFKAPKVALAHDAAHHRRGLEELVKLFDCSA
jgi:hypothetical protein